MAMRATFWGVRGSIPCPGPKTVRYGGNTLCIELRFDEHDRLIIIDAGSGIRELGNMLVKTDLRKGPIHTEIFLSHTHWDHILGFPFFAPIYIPGTKLKVFGPVTYEEESLDKIIGDQLRYRYFPVRHSELAAHIEYFPLTEGESDLGDGIILKRKYLNHPILDLGYRFEYMGKVFVTAFDTEPFRNVFDVPRESPDFDEEAYQEGESASREENEKILQFIHGANVLVYDSQYTHKEYEETKIGWGHSSFEYAINSAHKAEVETVVLAHHDPLRTDDELQHFENTYRDALRGTSNLEVIMAREGLTVEM